MAEIDAVETQEQRERTFFAAMAFVIAVTVFAGFSSYALRGMVPQPIPPLVHVHALLFGSWVVIFMAQTALIRSDSARLHRRVGWASLVVAAGMIVVGPLTAVEAVTLHRVPPFFPNGIFLALSFLEIACFAALVIAAIVLRRKTEWHRRLMLGTMFAVMGPVWGRILPMTALGALGGVAITIVLLVLYVGTAAMFDVRTRGRVHPAHYYSALAVVIENIGSGVLGSSPVMVNLAAALSSQ